VIQAFIIVLREGFEAFLIVAIIMTYLKRTNQRSLISAVWWGIGSSVIASGVLGLVLKESVNQALWEGVLGLVTMFFVGWLVMHMWHLGPRLKLEMETRLERASLNKTAWVAWLGVFTFTLVNITREGFETVIMLLQVRQSQFLLGVMLGAAAAIGIAVAWSRVSYLINVRRFFQVTGLFLLLFLVQVGMYSFHEFSEAGILPYSEWLHHATEQFSPYGVYGKWFSVVAVGVCAIWLIVILLRDKFSGQKNSVKQTVNAS